jgi:DedD protein
MTDQPFREIQLTGKQLFFLFMASVVLAVAIFLLGVTVGRGVRGALGEQPTTTTGAAAETSVAVGELPPTSPKPGELDYNKRLQAQAPATAPATEPPATPPAEAPPATKPAAPVVASPAAAPAAPPQATAKPPAGSDAPAAGGTWIVQAGAFATRAAADRVVATLRQKRFAAFVEPPGAQSSLFRVRVGPFPERAQAEATAARMKSEAAVGGVVTQRD